jgi:hypothetical protein
MTRHCMLAVCLLLAAAGTAGAQISPDAVERAGDPITPTPPLGPNDLDHYKCYFVDSPVQNIAMLLQDQFDLGVTPQVTEQVGDVRLVRFCNPVQKTLNGATTRILRPADHLALYLINPQQTIPRKVLISNQFGDQVLALRNAEILAVPTGAATPTATGAPPNTPAIPKNLDHYKCYAANGENIGVTVTLTDQFHKEVVQVLEPFLFCNPVHKTHPIGTPPTSIQRPVDHLACYKITPTPFQGAIYYNNQFVTPAKGPPLLQIAPADMLCAPSVKLKWYQVNAPPASVAAADE